MKCLLFVMVISSSMSLCAMHKESVLLQLYRQKLCLSGQCLCKGTCKNRSKITSPDEVSNPMIKVVPPLNRSLRN